MKILVWSYGYFLDITPGGYPAVLYESDEPDHTTILLWYAVLRSQLYLLTYNLRIDPAQMTRTSSRHIDIKVNSSLDTKHM